MKSPWLASFLCCAFYFLAIVSYQSLSKTQCLADDFVFYHEHVLGTSLELRANVANETLAQEVETIALDEIDRLANVLSNYDPKSEFRKWQTDQLISKRPQLLSSELTTVLERAEYWRQLSHGAFDARAEALTQLWKTAKSKQQLPTHDERAELVGQMYDEAWAVNGYQVSLKTDLPLTLDGLAKGYIIDCVIEKVLARQPDLRSLLVNIGGDLRLVGNKPIEITIENPTNAGENSPGIKTVTIEGSGAMATSGDYRRYFEIQGRSFSHIVDPRTGFTANQARSVSVIAKTAMDADAAATAFSVLTTEEALDLADSIEGMSCFIVERHGSTAQSRNWPVGSGVEQVKTVRLVRSVDDKAKGEAKEAEDGLLVKFSIVNKEGGRRYRRPYVAVWIEDKDNFPVKTAVLWLQAGQKGARWHRDLTRWYREDKTRKDAGGKELIGTASGATRGPGEYETRFDGTDNDGKPLMPGKYTLCLEVAREHGTYQLIRETFEWGDKPIAKTELKGNQEMSDVSFQFVPIDRNASTTK